MAQTEYVQVIFGISDLELWSRAWGVLGWAWGLDTYNFECGSFIAELLARRKDEHIRRNKDKHNNNLINEREVLLEGPYLIIMVQGIDRRIVEGQEQICHRNCRVANVDH